MRKIVNGKKVGTVIPMHRELKIGTIKGILRLAGIDEKEFSKALND